MTKMRAILTAGLILFALAGCTAPTEATNTSAPAEAEVPAVSTAPVESAAPLTPDTEPVEAAPVANPEETYLAEVRIRLKGMDGATDEQLVAGAHEACEMYAQGQTKDAIDIVDGDSPEEPLPGWNDGVIATWASFIYCTEFKVS